MVRVSPQEASKSRKRLGFVTSAFLPHGDQTSSFDFFAILTSQVLQYLQEDYDVVVRVPAPAKPNHIGRFQNKLLSELFASTTSFHGYIVSPFDVPTIAPAIMAFLRQSNSAPLITIDQSLGSSDIFQENGVDIPPAVVPNNRHGGELAAESLWNYYESFPDDFRPEGEPKFITVQGTGASPVRFDGFMNKIKELSRGKAVVLSKELPFSRMHAKRWVRDTLQEDMDAWQDVVGIFACNDELALGVSDGLDWHLKKPLRKHFIKAAVVGFDGIRDVAGRIRGPDELWLLNTVTIPIKEMAEQLAELLNELFSAEPNPTLETTVDCGLVKRFDEQTNFETFHKRRREWAKVFGTKLRPEVVAITVKPAEQKAVLDLLGETDPYEGANRTYSMGQIKRVDGTTLRVAVIQTLEQGIGAAQDTARDAIEDLIPKLIALVGIAGAKPALEYGLGDVIVCTRLHDLTMGAYIWDAKNKVSKELLTNIGGPMEKPVQDLIATFGRIAGQLEGWKASLVDSQPEFCLREEKIYAVADRDKLKESIRTRFEERKNPIFYAGSIASDGYLVKDPEVLDKWLNVAKDLVAIDMELPGIYVAANRRDERIPILAIRGISDVVGLEREHIWTEYACKTAASFFVHLLRVHPQLRPDSGFFVRHYST